MPQPSRDIPDWLATPERYRPGSDRDGFISKSLLSISSVLAFFRLDDGRSSRFSPSAPVKVLLALTTILTTSLSRNYLFVLIVLAGLLVRVALLPRRALARVVGGACGAAALSLIIMLPATFMGQPHAAVLMASKSLVCVGTTLCVALTTPLGELTRTLRNLHVPGVVILTIDLALRSIVSLGQTATEVLSALTLRSVGRNRRKRDAMGGIGGVVLLKASRSAQETYDAMRCRGFDGSYDGGGRATRSATDPLWIALGAGVVILFAHLQGLV